ncbi:non-ribosomal peptide synthetase, partial [Chryseobacterium defluvii]
MEIKDNTTTFKELLQVTAIEVRDVFSHKDYNRSELNLESFSTFSIQFGQKAENLKDDISLLYEEREGKAVLTIFHKENYPDHVVENLLNKLTEILSDYESLLNRNKKEYSFVDDKERHQLLEEFNDTKANYPVDKTIVQLFEEQVEKTPDNIAVIFEETVLTYRELNEKANQLAHYIKDNHAVAGGQVIATLLPKSIDLLISLLAVEKIGCIYLPIDINYPKDRIDYILEDSDAKILLSENNNIQTLSIYQSYISLKSDEIRLASGNNLNISIKPSDIAYLIYTSGSTGRPKGVLVEHHSNINMSLDQIKTFQVTSEDKIVWFASVAFDASISEVMMSLYSGAALCIPAEEEQKDISRFISFLERTEPTVVTFPPSYLDLLSNEDLKTLKTIITAGESANPVKAKEIVENGVNYYNAYGPTEYSVCTSIFKLESHQNYTAVPIGKPISNTRVYILDEDLNLVPVGVSGKLYVSGAGLSRGYLNKVELTAEKFVDNPFEAGSKMYDTGDLARWLPDGNLEFLGRKDFQVKIRGYRIELGEIESCITQFSSSIRQVVAESKEVNGEKVLVAYYTSSLEATEATETVGSNASQRIVIDKTVLREYLQSKLPDYMVPGYFVELEAIPLTPNGKIDRKSLPGVSGEDLIRREYVAPRNATEEKLSGIWSEVLGLEKVGVTDNFFELGGHSLMVAQVLNRIHRDLSKQISFQDFFTSPTIEGITKNLTGKDYTPIPQAPEEDSYPLTPSQHRLWVLSQLEGGSQAYNMPAVVILRGELHEEYFEKSFRTLIERHEILRTTFRSDKDSGSIRQYITPKEELHFTIEVLDFTGKNESEVEDYLQSANKEAFNLEKSPLIRASLLRRENEEHLFFLSMHHIIGDGWSTEVLVSEVVETYNRLLKGGYKENEKASELTIQYKDYAVWLEQEIRGDKYQKAESYWLEQFEGELPVLELPSYKSRPLIQTYNGDNISHQFSRPFTDKLKKYSGQHGVTLFMTLMAGVKALLYRYTGQHDIIVGTPIAGRDHPDLEQQIGLYLNTLAIRTILEEESNTFTSILAKEKETLLSAYEHQLYPFDELVGKLNIRRDMSRSALFDVMVVYQSQGRLRLGSRESDAEGLEVEEYEYRSKTSQFDVSYTFSEDGDQLGLTIEYNTDIYDEFLIERMFRHFENLLSGVMEDGSGVLTLEEIDILTDAERDQLLIAFNDTIVDYPRDKTMIELFEAQAEKTPENIAVVFEDTELTYRELNEQANQLGDYLRKNYDTQADDLIAIKLDRSEQMIVSILGVLKSGAAYVPIDPEYPEDRIAYIEEDTRAKITIDESFLKAFQAELQNTQHQYTKDNLPVISRPDSLAYIIYTSGTTGQPKGVMIENKSVVSIYECWKKEYELEKIDINLLQLASISFDVFVGDICRSLLNGGKMVICPNNIKLDVQSLYELLKKHQISILEGTPALLLSLCHEIIARKLDFSFLKIFIFGSDSFNNQDFLFIRNNFGKSIKVINSYGVTEATIDSTYFDQDLSDFHGTTPIGKPFSNSKIYIGNKNRLSPVGVYDKLYISGAGLSRGYLNKVELTAEKFVDNPFEAGSKMYDTGDLAR